MSLRPKTKENIIFLLTEASASPNVYNPLYHEGSFLFDSVHQRNLKFVELCVGFSAEPLELSSKKSGFIEKMWYAKEGSYFERIDKSIWDLLVRFTYYPETSNNADAEIWRLLTAYEKDPVATARRMRIKHDPLFLKRYLLS